MADSSRVDDVDIKLCMDKYYSRMNPTIPCMGCGVCGMVDIAIGDEDVKKYGV